MTWKDWVEKHSALYGFSSRGSLATFVELANLWQTCGFSPEEAWQASREIARTNPPKYLGDHLPTLRTRLDAIRASKTAQPTTQPAERVCGLCGGSGRVSVPSVKSLRHGKFTWLSVACRCPLGRWWEQRYRALGGISLDEYERDYLPDWREVVKQHQEELKAYARAASVTGSGLAGAVGRVIARTETEEKR